MADSPKPIEPEVLRLNGLIFQNRLKLGAVLRRARLPASTWSRWVQGAEPKISNLRKVEAAIHALISEKEHPDGRASRQDAENPAAAGEPASTTPTAC